MSTPPGPVSGAAAGFGASLQAKKLETSRVAIRSARMPTRFASPRRLLQGLCALLTACAEAQPTPSAPAVQLGEAPVAQLPRDVRPTHYTLALDIDPAKQGFSGTADIDLVLDAPHAQIWIDGRGLVIKEATAAGQPAKYEQVTEDGVARLTFAKPLAGTARLHFAWDAPFDPGLVGLYLAREAGQVYAFTQFEAIDARKAFPCFDDPAFKAPFDVTLTVPADQVVVANTLPVQEVAAGAKKSVTFSRTLPLPTYLLAWAVGPFDVVTPPPLPPTALRKRPLPMRGIAPKGRGAELAYGLEIAARLLPALEEYFGAEYPYDKLDHLAVPDYNFGAMENAGLITYREDFLLFREGQGSAQRKNDVAQGAAHEMAHQWFGDLVTLRWWTDAWLNEAFATWMGHKVVSQVAPEMLSEVEALKLTGGVMNADSLAGARSMRQPVEKNAEIWNAFELSTYYKGQAVLGMFERWIGRDKFQQGIREYIESHRNGSGSTDELLASLGKAAGRDVATPFHTFLEQPGLPLVSAQVSCEGQKGKVVLSQSRYLPLGSEGNRNQTWQLPVCVRYGDGKQSRESCTLLTEARGELPLDFCPLFLTPNAGAAGYYRYSLTGTTLPMLAAVPMSLTEQLQFSQNLRAAVRSNDVAFSDALQASANRVRGAPPTLAADYLNFLQPALHDFVSPALRPKARAWAADVFRDAGQRAGWEQKPGEDVQERAARGAILGFLALVARDPATLHEAARRGQAYLGTTAFDPKAVAPDLAASALAAYVREGGEQAFDAALARLDKTEDSEERERILAALGNTLDPKLGQRALALGLDPRLRKQERLIPLGQLATGVENAEAAFAWLQQNFDAVVAAIPEQHAAGIAGVFGTPCTQEHLDQVQAFFTPRVEKIAAAPRNLKRMLESLRLCVAQVKAQRQSADSFFSAKGGGGASAGAAK